MRDNKTGLGKGVALALSVILLLSSAAVVFAGGGAEKAASDKVYAVRLHHGSPEQDPTHMTALKFKELAEQYSGSRIQVEIFPNLQLGTEEEVIQLMRLGDIEMSIPYIGNLQPLAPSCGVLMLPYMWKTREELQKTVAATFDELNNRIIGESGVRLLAACDYDYRVLSNSVRPVERMEDIKGLKIRVSMNTMAIESFKNWGVNPTPLAWGEVFTALQQGVIEGIENPYTVVVSQKFYEVLKYTTEIHYLLETKPIIIAEKFYQSLPQDLKDVVARASNETRDYISAQFVKWSKEAQQELTSRGMVMLGPPKDEERWEKLARDAWPKFYDTVGGKEWAQKFISVKDSVSR